MRKPDVTGGNTLSTVGLSLMLVVMVVGLYGQVVDHEFVNLDDNEYVYANPHVTRGLTWDGALFAFTGPHSTNWHPLTTLSHMLDCELFGVDPSSAGPHLLVNVFLHALNAVLLLVALRYLTGEIFPSTLVAVLFAIHPLHVESVAWVSERKDVLSGTFCMSSLLAYGYYVRRPGISRFLVLCMSFTAGLMAKPMLVTLPFVLLLLDLWPLRRWRAIRLQPLKARDGLPHSAPRSTVQLCMEKLPLLGLSVAGGIATIVAHEAAFGSLEIITVQWRVLNSLVSYVLYLWKAICPVNFAVFYPHPTFQSAESLSTWTVYGIVAVLFLATVSMVVCLSLRKRPFLAVGWFWYLGMLVPVIGLYQTGAQAMADRYAYLPLIGIYIMITWSVRELVGAFPKARYVLSIVVSLVIASLLPVTFVQIGRWHDSWSLYGHAIQVTQNNFFVDFLLGTMYLNQRDFPQARLHLERAVSVPPVADIGHNNLGLLALEGEDLERARRHFELSIQANPQLSMGHNNLGGLYLRLGELTRAKRHFVEALRIEDDYEDAYCNLALVALREGEVNKARFYFDKTIRLNPGHNLALFHLGILNREAGDID